MRKAILICCCSYPKQPEAPCFLSDLLPEWTPCVTAFERRSLQHDEYIGNPGLPPLATEGETYRSPPPFLLVPPHPLGLSRRGPGSDPSIPFLRTRRGRRKGRGCRDPTEALPGKDRGSEAEPGEKEA